MNILHVASFIGNIGDNASHMGLYKILDHFFDNYNVEQLEIRKFYKNYNSSDKRYFNLDFVDYVNNFDLTIIGGGGFLDYWVPDSASGTTIDIAPTHISKIKRPLLITSVGCNPNKEIPKGNVNKFRTFLNFAIANPNVKIAVRNDGSVESIKNEIGSEYLKYIPEILDNGFFYSAKKKSNLPLKKEYISFNITCDQIEMLSKYRDKIDKDDYNKQLKIIVNYIVHDLKLNIVFVPHIYSDLRAISDLLTKIDEKIVRQNISVAPYLQGDNGADYLFSIYKQSKIVIGTRLHANICNLSSGNNTLGLAALDRIRYLYNYFGISDKCVTLDKTFSETLIYKLKYLCSIEKKDTNYLNDRFNSTLDIYETMLNSVFKH